MTLSARSHLYSAVESSLPVEQTAELVDGHTGCGELAKGGCLFAWNFVVTSSAVIRGGGKTID